VTGYGREVVEAFERTPSIGEDELGAIRREATDFAGVGLYRYTLSGRLVFIDRGALRLLGLEGAVSDPTELVGRQIGELYEPITPPGTLREAILACRQVKNFEYHYRTLRGDERWVHHNAYLIDAPGGPEPAIQVICHDITALKVAERALAASEARYRALVEQSSQGIVVTRTEPTPVVVYANSALSALAGAPSSAFVGQRPEALLRFTHPDDGALVAHHLGLRYAGVENRAGYDFRVVRADGEVRWVTGQSTLIEYEGRPAFQTTLTDTTERHIADERRATLEAQMQKAQRLESLGVLASGVAHDFNNILAAILGHAELAAARIGPGGAARPHIEQIERAAERAADLCRQMMVHAGCKAGAAVPVELNELVAECVHLLRASISKKVSLVVREAPGGLAVRGDPSRLRQVVMNLVVNAGEAIGAGEGSIRVTLDAREHDRATLDATDLGRDLCPGRYAVVEVADTGAGMGPAVLARIFEPFYSTKADGRGLGLATVRGIVKAHRGAIGVQSAPGAGTTFEVLLPLWSGESPGVAAAPPPDDAAPSGTVLVVDDEESLRAVIRQILERMGFGEILVAADGVEAVATFLGRSADIDVVLLDLTMPRLDGREVYTAIRRTGARVPIVFTSAYGADQVADLVARGEASFVQKPFRIATLREAITAALERGRAPACS
jgi:PAS domain S-box-containing protein